MSGGLSIVPARACDDPRLSDADRCVLMLLCCFVNSKSASCWPSTGRLAQRRGVDERTIRRSLSKLIEFGYITRKRRKQKTAVTTINFDTTKTGRAVSTLEDVKTGRQASALESPIPLKNAEARAAGRA